MNTKIERIFIQFNEITQREELTNGQTMDLLAGLFIQEVFIAHDICGQAGVTAAFDRFMRRVTSALPGLDFRMIEKTGKNN